MNYLGLFAITALFSTGATALMRWVAIRWNILDAPEKESNLKVDLKHNKPLLGGVAIFLVWTVVVLWIMPYLTGGYLLPKHIVGIILAGLVLVIGGILDDKFTLSPRWQIVFPLIAAGSIVASGIGITSITNPLGGVIQLDQWQWTVFEWHGLPYQLTLWADLFTVVWILGTTYTTKLLDGLDGLVPGITVIGGLILFALSLSDTVGQPETATLALVLAAAATGFLVLNFYPAKIILGESGALFTGFLLGVLAIISGGKIATALLILGLPIIDIIWVMIRRRWIEKRSMFTGDTSHLHYQLRNFGWSDPAIVLLYYGVTALFGVSTLLFHGQVKLIVLGVLAVISISLLVFIFMKARRQNNEQ